MTARFPYAGGERSEPDDEPPRRRRVSRRSRFARGGGRSVSLLEERELKSIHILNEIYREVIQ